MQHSILSANPEIRRQAWHDLRRRCMRNQFMLDSEELVLALSNLRNEDDEDIRRLGQNIFFELLGHRVFDKHNHAPRDLGHWLWQPCSGPSLSFWMADPSAVRDEDAIICISRRLSFETNSANDFVRINPANPDWGNILNRGFQAICIVGRLGLYGPEAVKFWSKQDLRYSFIADQRPANLPSGQIDAENYHALLERVWENGQYAKVRCFCTREENGQRIDYGLVQRYMVRYAGKRLIVITCGGLSGLGTLGAAKWAAEKLIGHDGEPLPLPEKVGDQSTMEAVIEVTAACAPHPTRWQPTDLKPVSLILGDSCWCNETRQWQRRAPDTITVCRDNRDSVTILFDGEPINSLRSKQVFRLIVKLCELAVKNRRQTVSIAALASDASLWGERVNDIEYVRGRLRELKTRRLSDALCLEADYVIVRAQIRFDDL